MAQFKRVWLKYDLDMGVVNSSGITTTYFTPVDGEETEKADAEIQKLLFAGWRIVSTAPVTKSVCFLDPKGDDSYATYTSGIEVFMMKD